MGQSHGQVSNHEDFAASSMDDKELSDSLTVISQSKECKSLDISFARMGPRSYEALCKVLTRATITKLDACSRGTFAVGTNEANFKAFCHSLSRNRSLRYLNLEGQNLSYSVALFGSSLQRGPVHLRVLNLGGNTLAMDPSFPALIEAIGSLPELHTLLLAKNGLGQQELVKLSGAICVCKNLRRLDISDNMNVPADLVKAISNQGGVYLLKCEGIYDKKVIDELQTCESLKQLIVVQPMLEIPDHRPFQHLQSLDLSRLNEAMMGALSRLPALRSLAIAGWLNEYSDSWMTGFRSLSKLCLRGGITPIALDALVDSSALGTRRLAELEVGTACDGFWGRVSRISGIRSLLIHSFEEGLDEGDVLPTISSLRNLVVTIRSRGPQEGLRVIACARKMSNLRRFTLTVSRNAANPHIRETLLKDPLTHVQRLVVTDLEDGSDLLPGQAGISSATRDSSGTMALACTILRAARQLLLAPKPWIMPRDIRLYILLLMDDTNSLDVDSIVQWAQDKGSLKSSVTYDDFCLLVSGADTSVFRQWDKSKFVVREVGQYYYGN